MTIDYIPFGGNMAVANLMLILVILTMLLLLLMLIMLTTMI